MRYKDLAMWRQVAIGLATECRANRQLKKQLGPATTPPPPTPNPLSHKDLCPVTLLHINDLDFFLSKSWSLLSTAIPCLLYTCKALPFLYLWFHSAVTLYGLFYFCIYPLLISALLFTDSFTRDSTESRWVDGEKWLEENGPLQWNQKQQPAVNMQTK